MSFTDGQQILIPDFNSITGTWGTQKAVIRIDTRMCGPRFRLEYESGLTLWGVSADSIQDMLDYADRIQKVDA
jgi:hypothetical protein